MRMTIVCRYTCVYIRRRERQTVRGRERDHLNKLLPFERYCVGYMGQFLHFLNLISLCMVTLLLNVKTRNNFVMMLLNLYKNEFLKKI